VNQMMRKMNFICVITGNYHDKRSSWVEKSMGVVILFLFFVKMGVKRCWEETIAQQSNTKWQYMYLM